MMSTRTVQPNAPRVLARSGIVVSALLLVALGVSLRIPLLIWFAVGAASGYSLSGSV